MALIVTESVSIAILWLLLPPEVGVNRHGLFFFSEKSVVLAGPAAVVRPVRPWPYQFLRDKNGIVCMDSNLRVRYRMASPSGSP